jgi:hypothetical protein
MLNCNLRAFDGRDNSKSRTEAGKLATLALCEIERQGGKNQQRMHEQRIKEQVADQSGGLVLREELIQFRGEGRDAHPHPPTHPPPFRSVFDRESIHVSHNKFPNHFN